MGSQIQALTNLLPSDNCDVELALINSQDDLRRAFTEYSSRYRSIRIIVIIGHSDAWGIRISTSQQMSLAWGAVAKWFQPFEPLYLVLAACKAGQCPSKAAFFDELESLEAMFASPVNISRLQAEILKVLVPYLLLVEEIDPEEIFVGQVLTFLGSGAILLYCQRQDSDWNNLLQVGTLLRDLFS